MTHIEIAKGTTILLNEQRSAVLLLKQDISIKMSTVRDNSKWVVKVGFFGEGMLSEDRKEKVVPLENGQHLLIGCYKENAYKRPESVYIDLSEILEEKGEVIHPKDEALCELSSVGNGVLTVSRWGSLFISNR